jgi:uncharacterized membrane protein YphA (DoxX/SURF4 family)
MNFVQRMEKWGDAHHPKWIDFIRIVLGIILTLKGVQFINNMQPLVGLIAESGFLGSLSAGLLAHYVVFAHLLGGLMVAFGLLTRFACLVQIPVLLGAIIFINISGDIFQPHSELWLSVLILILLVFFVVEGSGKLSVDEWMRRNPDERPHRHKWG